MQMHVEIPLPHELARAGLCAKVVPLGSDDATSPVASRWAGNLLQLTPQIIESIDSGSMIVNSGSLADDLGALEPRNWLGAGNSALTAHLASLHPALRSAQMRLLIEPCSRHIVHDAQATLLFMREQTGQPVGLALNPTGLFEPSMLGFREDHLLRIAESLAPHCEMLILAGVRLDRRQERFVQCEPDDGEFDALEVLAACGLLLPADASVVLRTPTGRLPGAALLEHLSRI